MRNFLRKCFEENDITLYHELPNLTWEKAKNQAPSLTRGWFELSKLENSLRIEFLRDYWINSLPYFPHVFAFIDRFFSRVDEVAIIGAKNQVYAVYCVEDSGFLGGVPLLDEQVEAFKQCAEFPWPQDYSQFFRIHNGFKRAGDSGILALDVALDEMVKVHSWRESFQCHGEQMDSKSLFPFYRSFNSDVYQCLCKEWYVGEEVGNVLCSLPEGTISDFRTYDRREKQLAFPTFLDWLIFYLEDVE